MIGKKRRQGQAALEFLTTYGWAFLVILVMISALGYFGILNPDRFLPETCNSGPNFACEEYAIYRENGTNSSATGSNLDVILVNQVGESIQEFNVTRIQVRNAIATTGFTCEAFIVNGTSPGAAVSSSDSVRAGESIWLACNLSTNQVDLFGPVGAKTRIDLDVNYKALGRSISRPLALRVYAATQD